MSFNKYVTSVVTIASSTTLLAAENGRRSSAMIYNTHATNPVYIHFGEDDATTANSIKLAASTLLTIPFACLGEIQGITGSGTIDVLLIEPDNT